jgi:glycine C-acetyltransferase
MGYDTGNSETPITPVIVGESSVAKKLSDGLIANGVFALPIVFPMVARDKARIRNMVNAGLTKDDLNEILRVYEKLGKDLKLI